MSQSRTLDYRSVSNTEVKVNVAYRQLTRAEIDKLHHIDRTETIEGVYKVREGELVLEPEHWEVPDWGAQEKQRRVAILQALHDQGAMFWGAFDGATLVGMSVLNPTPLSSGEGRLELAGLWVSQAYRKRGIGRALVRRVQEAARRRGARSLYVSATPSESTIRFYQSVGFTLAAKVDPALYAEEPEDVHMEMRLA